MRRFVAGLVPALSLVLAAPAAAAAADLALAGRLLDRAGNPVSGGTVTLYPSVDPAGQATVEPLASVATDRVGRFTLRAGAAPELAAAAAVNGGWANVAVVASDGRRMTYRALTLRLDESRTTASTPAPAPATLELVLGGPASAPVGRSAAPGPCPYIKRLLGATNRYTTVGELHTGRNQSAWFRYGRSADSDIGVGLSYDGRTWRVSGERHVGNEHSSYVEIRRGARFAHRLLSSFRYAKYRHATCFRSWYTVEATRWNSGILVGSDQSFYDGRCRTTYGHNAVAYARGTSFHRDRNDFERYTFAVSVFGATLSAQSGASTSVQSHWKFGRRHSRYWLCGDNGMPPYAHRIFAG